MRVVVKKLYKGRVDVRDYIASECILKKENCEVQHNGDIMTLSPEDLRKKIVSKSPTFKSKTGGKDYRLLSYEWTPDEVSL